MHDLGYRGNEVCEESLQKRQEFQKALNGAFCAIMREVILLKTPYVSTHYLFTRNWFWFRHNVGGDEEGARRSGEWSDQSRAGAGSEGEFGKGDGDGAGERGDCQ